MENLHKRIRMDLGRASEMDQMCRLVADAAYQSHKIFKGDLVVSAGLRLWRPWCTQKNEAPCPVQIF